MRRRARPPDPVVDEPGGAHRRRVEHVATVDEDRRRHRLRPGRPVDVGELGPLRDEDGGVGACECLLHRVHLHDTVQAVGARHRIPRPNVGTLREQSARQHEARRFTHVVGVRLEGEPEQRHRLPAQRPEVLLELPDHARFWSSFTSITAFRSWKW